MAERVVVDQIDFRSALVFPRVLNAATGAFQPSRLLAATFIVLALAVAGRFYDALRGSMIQPAGLLSATRSSMDSAAIASDVARRALQALPVNERAAAMDSRGGVDIETVSALLQNSLSSVSETDADGIRRALDRLEPYRRKGTFDSFSVAVGRCIDDFAVGVLTVSPVMAVAAFGNLFINLPLACWREDRWFCFVFGAAFLLAMGAGGAVLCRMTAIDLAGKAKISAADAFEFVKPRWINHALVPVWPMFTLVVLLPVAAMLGWLSRIPLIDIFAGLAYGLVIVLSFFAAIALIPWGFCMPLAVAAAACEGCDGLEAAQRTVAYVLRRPLQGLLYLIMAAIGFSLVIFVSDLFAMATLSLASNFVGMTAGDGPMSGLAIIRLLLPDDVAPVRNLGFTASISAGFVGLWITVVKSLAAGACFGAFWAVATAAYLALRKTCDDQPFDDLWMPGTAAGSRQDQTA
ncbi:MAG: hypothetical protein EXS12_07450 [Phycisphaerales bacterium]|nr:hypothetical protein [Phycisphaerales bacterium]